MQKNQYQQYKKLTRIRDMVIAAVLLLVGIFYYASLSEADKAEVQVYRAETAEQVKESRTAAAAAGAGEIAGAAPAVIETAAPETEGTAPPTVSTAETTFAETSIMVEVGVVETSAEADARVNLNTADLEELDSLPGIGPATAKLILEYRRQYGGFAAPEEIMNVKRIGEKTYEKLKDRIRV